MGSLNNYNNASFSLFTYCMEIMAVFRNQIIINRWLKGNLTRKKSEFKQLVVLVNESKAAKLNKNVDKYANPSIKNLNLKEINAQTTIKKLCNAMAIILDENYRDLACLSLDDISYLLEVSLKNKSINLQTYSWLKNSNDFNGQNIKIFLPQTHFTDLDIKSLEINMDSNASRIHIVGKGRSQDYEPEMEHKKKLAPLAINFNQKENIMKNHENETIINEILGLIGEGEARIKDKVEKAVLLFGRTGAGKSTLTYLLAQKPLQAFQDESLTWVVDAMEPIKEISIGHRAESETKIPGKLDISGLTIWDLPGFNDTSTTQEIANAFYIRRACENSKELKFILIMTESAILQDRGSNAVEIIKQFARVFTDINALDNCVSLVITQVNNKNKEAKHFKDNLLKIIEQNPLIKDNTEVKKILGFLIKSIHVFHVPEETGQLTPTNLLSDIESSTFYLPSKPNLINIAIGENSKPYVKDLLKNSEEKLEKVCQVIIEAIKKANLCMDSNNKNIFMQSYDIIKDSLSTSSSLSDKYKSDLRIPAKYFAQLDQLDKLAKSLPENYDHNNITSAFIDVLGIFNEFAKSANLKQKIQEYLEVFELQNEYVRFLSEVCHEESLGIYTTLCEMMKSSKLSILDQMKSQLCSLKLENTTEAEYYIKAIKYLDYYPLDANCKIIKAKCYDHLGDICEGSGKIKEAFESYSTALQLNKNSPEVYEKVGDLLFKINKFSEALIYFKSIKNPIKVADCFKELIELHPYDANLREEKGDYYSKSGVWSKAIKSYQEAFCLTKNDDVKKNLNIKQSDILKNHNTLSNNIAEKLILNAQNTELYDFDLISSNDLTELANFQPSVIGDNYYIIDGM